MLLPSSLNLQAVSFFHVSSLQHALLYTFYASLFAYLIFHKYEPSSGPALTFLLILLPSLCAYLIYPHLPNPTSSSYTQPLLIAYTLYLSTISLLTIAYRLSPFHPLAKFPGPTIAKITKFWNIWVQVWGKQHLYIQGLHAKYGPYVRFGPNELSFLDADAIAPIYNAGGFPKGPAADGRRSDPTGHRNLIVLRDPKEHTRRRRYWVRAFTPSAIKDYEPNLVKRALELVEHMSEDMKNNAKKGVDLAKWMSCFTVDFMGDMAFGGGFELMRDGDTEGVWTLLENGLRFMSLSAHIPWAEPWLTAIPPIAKDSNKLRSFAMHKGIARKARGSEVKDIFHYLMDEDGTVEPTPPTFKQIISDSVVAMVGGSDSTATVLSNIFYYLLSNPAEYERLQREVDEAFPRGEKEPFDTTKQSEMVFLNAVINETLRIQPPVPDGSQRAPEPGSGGKMVCGHFIPEGTAIFVPTYSIHRDPRYFYPAPDKFWPDRWIKSDDPKAEIITSSPSSPNPSSPNSSTSSESKSTTTTPTAFIPFSWGPANCVGKSLAMMELRLVTCLIMYRFELSFADGEDGEGRKHNERWEDELKDWWLLKKGKLMVKLTPRS